MHVSTKYTEFDVTPHVQSSATVDEHGHVTYESISLFPFGDFNVRTGIGTDTPSMIIMSVDEADAMARLLLGAVTDARKGRYNTIDRD
jgi:hypothetical protein